MSKHERDWQKDWELVCEVQARNDPQTEFQRVLDVCIYWLCGVRELKTENHRLRAVAEAALEYLETCRCDPGLGWEAWDECHKRVYIHQNCPRERLKKALAAREEVPNNGNLPLQG